MPVEKISYFMKYFDLCSKKLTLLSKSGMKYCSLKVLLEVVKCEVQMPTIQ